MTGRYAGPYNRLTEFSERGGHGGRRLGRGAGPQNAERSRRALRSGLEPGIPAGGTGPGRAGPGLRAGEPTLDVAALHRHWEWRLTGRAAAVAWYLRSDSGPPLTEELLRALDVRTAA